MNINFQRRSFAEGSSFTARRYRTCRPSRASNQFNHSSPGASPKRTFIGNGGKKTDFYSFPFTHHVGRKVNIIRYRMCGKSLSNWSGIAVPARNYKKKHGISHPFGKHHAETHPQDGRGQLGWTPDINLKQAADNVPIPKEFLRKLIEK